MSERDVFTALADPTRRRILDLLREDERTVSELVRLVGSAQPNVSKHLKVLGAAALVEVRVDGPRRRYTLRSQPLYHLDSWLAPFRRAWADRLDALETRLDQMTDDPEKD